MPAYEYRCRVCHVSFEVRRGISSDTSAPTPCPAGHQETSRIFSAVAVSRGAAAPAMAAAPAGGGGGGACCGGGCCG
ncbi:zinc ribbon domain-containing protein [Frankia sp. EI5c]|uniref:FmdB family zinc ribbon protein n=1 Tax=Frankia sp. EI5c TaxID=683316 RepID=UPI000A01B61B|nr:zinc ribbon domain-containing protein [Frankia sp. EI5c]